MLLVVFAISVASLAYSIKILREATRPLIQSEAPPPLPPDHGDVRFGVPLTTRKAVFTELAKQEPASRAKGHQAFPGPELDWSAEDHRAGFERKSVAAAMARHKLSMTQVYLILDEGIRQHWAGPDGEPLRPTTVPLHPRRKY